MKPTPRPMTIHRLAQWGQIFFPHLTPHYQALALIALRPKWEHLFRS